MRVAASRDGIVRSQTTFKGGFKMLIDIDQSAFFQEDEIISVKKFGKVGILPVSKSTWRKGILDGKFPRPVQLGSKTNYWSGRALQQLLDDLHRQ